MTFQHRAGVSPYTSPCGFAQACVFAKQLLGPLLCGRVSPAPLLPKLRGHFAEFLGDASPAGLGILSLSTCVGLRYGCAWRHSGFSRHGLCMLPYLSFGPRRGTASHGGLPSHAAPPLAPVSSLPAHAPPMRPRSSGHAQYRNVHLSSIGYALRPRLRSRLTQGRSALPWKPRTSGLGDSHPHLATHSGILSSQPSTAPHRCGFAGLAMLPYQCDSSHSRASAARFSPGHFRRRASRLVSYYALFQCMAASEPTS